GNKTTIKNRSLRPFWDKDGANRAFQVDHKHELQLSGGEGIDNLWLLDGPANESSGRNIRGEKNSRVQKLLNAATKAGVWETPPDLELVRKTYDIEVKEVEGGLEVTGDPDKTWTLDEIKKGDQFDYLKTLSKKEVDDKGLQGSPSQIVIYTNEAGGGIRISKG